MNQFTPAVRTRRDLRTLGGQPRTPLTSHTLYGQLFALRGERHQHQLERARAQRRIAHLDARCATIDQDQRALRRVLTTLARVPGPRRHGVGG